MKELDWQHVVIAVAGLALCGVCIVLGHGNTLLQIAAALGGGTGIAGLLKSSPLTKPEDK